MLGWGRWEEGGRGVGLERLSRVTRNRRRWVVRRGGGVVGVICYR